MRAVISRVHCASVTVDDQIVGQISRGFLVLLGIGRDDTKKDAEWLSDRICKLRVFEDAAGKMNISPSDAKASLLIVSNFTLFGDCASTRRPSFSRAAPPDIAKSLYEHFTDACRTHGLPVQTGIFGADMRVDSSGDGPVTLWLDTAETDS